MEKKEKEEKYHQARFYKNRGRGAKRASHMHSVLQSAFEVTRDEAGDGGRVVFISSSGRAAAASESRLAAGSSDGFTHSSMCIVLASASYSIDNFSSDELDKSREDCARPGKFSWRTRSYITREKKVFMYPGFGSFDRLTFLIAIARESPSKKFQN